MGDAHGWVLLVQCQDVAELHAVRATLEDSGVPCPVLGEHTHGIMGAFHGAAVRSRVLVPAPALAVARTLVQDIVGPFDGQAATPDEPADESPFRRSAEILQADDAEPPEPPAVRLKSYSRLLLVALLVLGPFIGLGHVYAGRNARAGILLLVSVFALPAALSGAGWAQGALAGVWLTDIVGAALEIAAHNRRVTAAAATPGTPLGRG